MRSFTHAELLTRLALVATTAAIAVPACDAGPGGDGADANGAVGIALQVAPGLALTSVGYTITGPTAYARTGAITVADSATLSAVISPIPVGAGYALALDATTTDGGTTCAGAAIFDVAARATTIVPVHLLCHEVPRSGGVLVNGTINVCPIVDGIDTGAIGASGGSAFVVSAIAHDVDNGPSTLAYAWTASAGTFSDASVSSPTFTCAAAGPVTLTVSVSDGDPTAGCPDTRSTSVTCGAAACAGGVCPAQAAAVPALSKAGVIALALLLLGLGLGRVGRPPLVA